MAQIDLQLPQPFLDPPLPSRSLTASPHTLPTRPNRPDVSTVPNLGGGPLTASGIRSFDLRGRGVVRMTSAEGTFSPQRGSASSSRFRDPRSASSCPRYGGHYLQSDHSTLPNSFPASEPSHQQPMFLSSNFLADGVTLDGMNMNRRIPNAKYSLPTSGHLLVSPSHQLSYPQDPSPWNPSRGALRSSGFYGPSLQHPSDLFAPPRLPLVYPTAPLWTQDPKGIELPPSWGRGVLNINGGGGEGCSSYIGAAEAAVYPSPRTTTQTSSVVSTGEISSAHPNARKGGSRGGGGGQFPLHASNFFFPSVRTKEAAPLPSASSTPSDVKFINSGQNGNNRASPSSPTHSLPMAAKDSLTEATTMSPPNTKVTKRRPRAAHPKESTKKPVTTPPTPTNTPSLPTPRDHILLAESVRPTATSQQKTAPSSCRPKGAVVPPPQRLTRKKYPYSQNKPLREPQKVDSLAQREVFHKEFKQREKQIQRTSASTHQQCLSLCTTTNFSIQPPSSVEEDVSFDSSTESIEESGSFEQESKPFIDLSTVSYAQCSLLPRKKSSSRVHQQQRRRHIKSTRHCDISDQNEYKRSRHCDISDQNEYKRSRHCDTSDQNEYKRSSPSLGDDLLRICRCQHSPSCPLFRFQLHPMKKKKGEFPGEKYCTTTSSASASEHTPKYVTSSMGRKSRDISSRSKGDKLPYSSQISLQHTSEKKVSSQKLHSTSVSVEETKMSPVRAALKEMKPGKMKTTICPERQALLTGTRSHPSSEMEENSYQRNSNVREIFDFEKRLPTQDLDVMRDAFARAARTNPDLGRIQTTDGGMDQKQDIDLTNLRPVDLQTRAAETEIALADIQAANRKNLLLTQNPHVSEMITKGLMHPVSVVDEERSKATLASLNPGIDPDALLKALLSSYKPSKAMKGESFWGSKSEDERRRLETELQGLLNDRLATSEVTSSTQKETHNPSLRPATPITSTPQTSLPQDISHPSSPKCSPTEDEDDLPGGEINSAPPAMLANLLVDCEGLPWGRPLCEFTAEQVQKIINAEVTAQLRDQASIRLSEKKSGENNQSDKKDFFDRAILRAMQALQNFGLAPEQLSGASVQVPADVMRSLGMGKQSEEESVVKDNNPTVDDKPHCLLEEESSIPPRGLLNGDGKEDVPSIDQRFSAVTHKHISTLEIEYDTSERSVIREVDVIEIYEDPSILILANLLTKEECEEILSCSEGHWQACRANKVQQSPEKEPSGVYFARLLRNTSMLIPRLYQRLACALQVDLEKLEDLAVVKFEEGCDVPTELDGPTRSKTMIIFLNDVDKGGETDFPCLGFQVRSQQGTAVCWSNLISPSGSSNRQTDTRVLRCSLPPVGCPKFVLTCYVNSPEISL